MWATAYKTNYFLSVWAATYKTCNIFPVWTYNLLLCLLVFLIYLIFSFQTWKRVKCQVEGCKGLVANIRRHMRLCHPYIAQETPNKKKRSYQRTRGSTGWIRESSCGQLLALVYAERPTPRRRSPLVTAYWTISKWCVYIQHEYLTKHHIVLGCRHDCLVLVYLCPCGNLTVSTTAWRPDA
jgi:hypothetical protein